MPMGRRGGFGGGFGMGGGRRIVVTRRPIFRPAPFATIATAAVVGAAVGSIASQPSEPTIIVQEKEYEKDPQVINVNVSTGSETSQIPQIGQPVYAAAQPVVQPMPYQTPQGMVPVYPPGMQPAYPPGMLPTYPTGMQPPVYQPNVQQGYPAYSSQSGVPPYYQPMYNVPTTAPYATAPPDWELLDTEGIPTTGDLIDLNKKL